MHPVHPFPGAPITFAFVDTNGLKNMDIRISIDTYTDPSRGASLDILHDVSQYTYICLWGAVKIMVPFWAP